MRAFGDATTIHKDCMLHFLISSWKHDGLVLTCLQVILPALRELALKFFKDHLLGVNDNVTDDLKLKTASVQKHSKFTESVFLGPTS